MEVKERIISEAIRLFNKSGFASVTLFELSQHLGMSRGNLTYHFKTKDTLLEAIVDDMLAKMEVQRSKSRQFPSFENLHNEVQLYFKFQKSYAFIFLDTTILNHKKVHRKIQELSIQSISDNKAAIAFAIQLENMHPEPFPGVYHNIAVTTWMLAFFWSAQKKIRNTDEDGEKMIWSLLVPYFTEKGIASFKKFFGTSYYKELGASFTFDVNKYISF